MSDELDLFEGYDDDVSLEPEDKKHIKPRSEWFKGSMGRVYRVSLLYFHPLDVIAMKAAKKKDSSLARAQLLEIGKKNLQKRAEERSKAVDELLEHEKLYTQKVQFRLVKAFYNEQVKYVTSRLGLDGPEADRVWNSLGEEKTYFFTVYGIYHTDNEGNVKGDNFIVVPARLSQKTYEKLHQVGASLRSNDLSIATQDLLIKCTNVDYQQFDINPAGKAEWLKNSKLRDEMLARAVKEYPLIRKPFQVLSTTDLKIKLGLETSTGSDVSDDFEGVLDNV